MPSPHLPPPPPLQLFSSAPSPVDDIPLPHLSFSSPSLSLLSINRAAIEIFGHPPKEVDARWFFMNTFRAALGGMHLESPTTPTSANSASGRGNGLDLRRRNSVPFPDMREELGQLAKETLEDDAEVEREQFDKRFDQVAEEKLNLLTKLRGFMDVSAERKRGRPYTSAFFEPTGNGNGPSAAAGPVPDLPKKAIYWSEGVEHQNWGDRSVADISVPPETTAPRLAPVLSSELEFWTSSPGVARTSKRCEAIITSTPNASSATFSTSSSDSTHTLAANGSETISILFLRPLLPVPCASPPFTLSLAAHPLSLPANFSESSKTPGPLSRSSSVLSKESEYSNPNPFFINSDGTNTGGEERGGRKRLDSTEEAEIHRRQETGLKEYLSPLTKGQSGIEEDGDEGAPNAEAKAIAEDQIGHTVRPPRPASTSSDSAVSAATEKMKEERHFHKIVDGLPQICFTATKDGHVDYFNKQWYVYTGLSLAESKNESNWLQLFHSDDMPSAILCWEASVLSGEPFDVEYRIKGADGLWRWMVARGRPLRDSHGEVESWVSTITEVEELVRVRSDALQVKERIAAVLSGANIVLLSVDRSCTVTFFEGSLSSAMALGTGGGLDAPLVGEDLRNVWPDPRLHDAVSKILDENLESVTLLTEVNSAELADMHSYRYRLVPLKGGAGLPDDLVTGVIIVAADVTQLVAAEEALQRAQEERRELVASELAAKDASRFKSSFVENMSHEIRTPIAGIIGICELLLDDESLPVACRNLVEKSLRSGEILLDLVGMVLDMGKVEAGKLEIEHRPFHLSEAISDAALFSVLAQKKGIEFREEIGDFYTGALLGDRLRLRQVLANGLSNANKFTSSGNITFRVRQVEETASQIVVEFIIADSGIGISKTVLPTLFTPFHQADASTQRRFGGSGLGLVISKSLVELMGGNVKLESVSGVSTTMTVLLPFDKAPLLAEGHDFSPSLELDSLQFASANGKKVDEGSEQEKSRNARRANVRILLAEDNDLIREIVTRTLVKMKFSVHAVADGAAAVEAVEKERFDVILMDGQMPVLDGYAATQQIRRSTSPVTRAVRIIALTASAIRGDRERCLAYGMNSYCAKPVRARDLEKAIWEQLDLVEEHKGDS